MSQKNDESNALALAMGFLGAAAMLFFFVIFTIAAFLTFVLTILCLLSWNKPLQIGKLVFMPEESRAFVKFGIAGAFIVPAFVFCASVFLTIPINWDYLTYMMLGGYMLGSLGIVMMMNQDVQEVGPPTEYTPPGHQLPAPPRQSLQRQEPENFRFASWDDEDDQA